MRLLRSSFGAIEDWNLGFKTSLDNWWEIAIVFRGDRGLERIPGRKFWSKAFHSDCDRLSGRSRIGTSWCDRC